MGSGDSDTENPADSPANESKNYNRPITIDPKGKAMVEKEDRIKAYFQDIIEYLGSETNRFHVIFTSVFAKGKADGARFGMDELARSVLPK